MNKHSIIVIAASIVIAGSVGYSFSNAFALEDVKFRWHQKGGFDFISMMQGGKILLCNTSDLPVSANGITMDMYFDGKKLGTYFVDYISIDPKSKAEAYGISDMKQKGSHVMLLFMDTEFSGTDISRIDENKMFVQVNYHANILGFIPYSVSNIYQGYEFYQIMNDVSHTFQC